MAAIRHPMCYVIVALTLLSACDLTEPLPRSAERFTPPAIYQEWWRLTEQCSGRTGDMADVTWYHVPGSSEIPLGDGSMVAGRWEPGPNRIVLAGDAVLAGDLVRHEMLHALLRAHGHPRSEFVGKCGGTVVCIRECLTAGGPAPSADPNARVVAPSAITVGVDVTPLVASPAVDGGHITMVVTATNPAATPVIVQLTSPDDSWPPVSFSHSIDYVAGRMVYDMRAYAVEVTRFAPFETKRFIFDFHASLGNDTRYEIAPGTYVVNGAYGRVWAPNPPTITVTP